jgi:hypothetical protein
MNKDNNVIKCQDCGQTDRSKSCINGSRYHNFVRTQISECRTELKQIWDKRQ